MYCTATLLSESESARDKRTGKLSIKVSKFIFALTYDHLNLQ